MGVVTGIPMEFQFGTNWARFSKDAGGVIGPDAGIVDWYTLLLIGAAAFAALAIHGCYWVTLKTSGDLQQR